MDDALELSRLGQLPAVLLAVCSQLQAGLEQLLDKGLVALEVKHHGHVQGEQVCQAVLGNSELFGVLSDQE